MAPHAEATLSLGAGTLRRTATPEQMRRAVDRLRARRMAAGPPTAVTLRDIPLVHPPEIMRPIDARLVSVVENGSACYIEGATVGVGLSPLLADFANGFNLLAGQTGDPRRIGHLALAPGSRSVPKFLDALGAALRAPISTTELRFRDPGHLARRILASARMAGIATLIFDRVNNASEAVREAIGFLLLSSDPRYTVVWEADELCDPDWRVGVVIADAHPPEAVFRNHPEVLLSLDGGTLTFPPYTTPEQVAHVLRHADIGLDDLELDRAADRELAERVLLLTSGLAAQMEPLLRLTDLVARRSGLDRPTLACVEAAARVIPKLVWRTESAHPLLTDATVHDLVVRPPPKRRKTLVDPTDPQEATTMRKAKKSRSEHLKEKREARDIAEAEGRDMSRRSHRG